MIRLLALLLTAALLLSCAGCGDKTESTSLPAPTVGAVAGASTPADGSGSGETSASFNADAEPAPSLPEDAQTLGEPEFDHYLQTYVAPYGCLTTYTDDWTNPEQLGADRLVEAALQIGFRYFRSAHDYSLLYGDTFLRLQIPEAWADANYGVVYPQDQIENITIEYFGVDGEFLRTSQYYIPARDGYALLTDEVVTDELLPVVTGVRRSEKRAEITYDLKQPDSSGKPAGDAVRTKVMTIEDKAETFRFLAVVAPQS